MTQQPPGNPVPHMSPDQFRRLGREMVDFIADYWQSLEQLPVAPATRPGDVFNALPGAAPEAAAPTDEDWNRLLGDVGRLVIPNITNWQAPGFYGFFPANISGPAVLGELLAAGLGVQGMLWRTSPACTELETRVLDWLGQAIGLPSSFMSAANHSAIPAPVTQGGGVIQSTASEATLVALVAARRRALSHGADPASLVAYASTQAHSSVLKASMIAGLARDASDHTRLRFIATDRDHALDPDVLTATLRADRAVGLTPFFAVATVGTTSSTAIDPVDRIAAALAADAAGFTPWLHVDGAHAAAACICPEFRHFLNGVEHADSFCFNPHKWLLVNFDCDCFWTRDRATLIEALSVTPEYLRNTATDSGQVIDYRDWQIPLGRRFRALKLWFVLRHYGIQGLQAYIRRHVALAARLESLLAAMPHIELTAPRTCNLVCFALKARPDADQLALMERLNATGRFYLTHTALPVPAAPDSAGGSSRTRVTLRVAVGSPHTTEAHIDELAAAIAHHSNHVT